MPSSTATSPSSDLTDVEQENEMTDADDGALTFDRDIKPLFREGDRSSMLAFFDLWSFDDVKENAGAILEAVRSGSMPCDGAWSGQKVDLLERWVETGAEP
jgi:hypothetical protein